MSIMSKYIKPKLSVLMHKQSIPKESNVRTRHENTTLHPTSHAKSFRRTRRGLVRVAWTICKHSHKGV